MFTLNPRSTTPLVVQIVEGFRVVIHAGGLRPGAKVPSIRQFAHAHGVSTYTVVDAYDRLVALGYFVSRPHSGFFVRQRDTQARGGAFAGSGAEAANYSFDSMWYLRRVFEAREMRLKPGCGWLPGEWLFEDGLRRSLRTLASESVDLGGYGEPKGFPLKRKQEFSYKNIRRTI